MAKIKPPTFDTSFPFGFNKPKRGPKGKARRGRRKPAGGGS
jgi:hypothetical protein